MESSYSYYLYLSTFQGIYGCFLPPNEIMTQVITVFTNYIQTQGLATCSL